jgi:two-component system sensor histidine kinase BarA
MIQRKESRFGIRQRILVLTLLPLLAISIVLGGFFIYTRFQDAEMILVERGQLLARLVASSSEFALITGNAELLKSISKGPFQEKDVADVLFLNGQYELIQRSAQFPVDLKVAAPSAYMNEHYWYFTQPVSTTGIPFLDNPEFQESENVTETVGWVIVIMSENTKIEQEQRILIASGSLLSFTFAITFFLAFRFGKRISQPILGLTQVMNRMQVGNLDTRVSQTYTGEFNQLANGLNGLADTIQKLVTNQQNRISNATRKLEAALHHLEEQNDALNRARRRADDANLAKDEFLARMSHELRTPLTSVVGFAKLLNQTECSPEQHEHIRIINQTSMMLLSIIDDILDFSKLQQDAITLEEIDFNLEEIIYDILEMQAPKAHEKGLELIPHLPSTESLSVLGDPTRLRQIIANLVGNAVKFTHKGSVEIHVETNYVNRHKQLFTIKVIDTGIGIHAAHMAQLFQAFTQADTSITRRFGGSGLGLVISKKLTELMGGRLDMISEENIGTTVTLSIPFMEGKADSPVIIDSNNAPHSVLVFEPNVSYRRSLIDMIRNHPKGEVSSLSIARTLDECMVKHTNHDITVLSLPSALSPDEETLYQSFITLLSNKSTPSLVLSPTSLGITCHGSVALLHKPVRPATLYRHLGLSYQLPKADDHIDTSQLSHTVVLAEDNEFNRLLITKILESTGIKVIPAGTGLEAVEYTREHEPHVVIMDVHMPIMDGLEATQHIKETHPQIPVIALTANIIAHEHEALMEAGIDQILLKPVNDKELVQAISLISAHQQTVSLPPPQNPVFETEPEVDSKTTSLDRYNIDNQDLQDEVRRLTDALLAAFKERDLEKMAEINHQLAGLASFYEMPEVEICSSEIHEQVRSETCNWRLLWKSLWQLKRSIEDEPIELNDE